MIWRSLRIVATLYVPRAFATQTHTQKINEWTQRWRAQRVMTTNLLEPVTNKSYIVTNTSNTNHILSRISQTLSHQLTRAFATLSPNTSHLVYQTQRVTRCHEQVIHCHEQVTNKSYIVSPTNSSLRNTITKYKSSAVSNATSHALSRTSHTLSRTSHTPNTSHLV